MAKSFVFKIQLQKEKDGRWSVWVPALPGCASWGDTREEALVNIQDAVDVYVRDMLKAGEAIPRDSSVLVLDEPAVTVNVLHQEHHGARDDASARQRQLSMGSWTR